jgi:hypothetical protein
LLDAGTLPLTGRVIGQPLRYRVAIEHQAVEHQRKVGVGDAPLAKQVIAIDQAFGDADQALGGGLAGSCWPE